MGFFGALIFSLECRRRREKGKRAEDWGRERHGAAGTCALQLIVLMDVSASGLLLAGDNGGYNITVFFLFMTRAGREFWCEKMRAIFKNKSAGCSGATLCGGQEAFFSTLLAAESLSVLTWSSGGRRIREPSYRLGLNETEK